MLLKQIESKLLFATAEGWFLIFARNDWCEKGSGLNEFSFLLSFIKDSFFRLAILGFYANWIELWSEFIGWFWHMLLSLSLVLIERWERGFKAWRFLSAILICEDLNSLKCSISAGHGFNLWCSLVYLIMDKASFSGQNETNDPFFMNYFALART